MVDRPDYTHLRLSQYSHHRCSTGWTGWVRKNSQATNCLRTTAIPCNHRSSLMWFISRPFFLVFFLFQPTWTRLWTQLKGARNRTTIPTLKWRSWSYFKHLWLVDLQCTEYLSISFFWEEAQALAFQPRFANVIWKHKSKAQVAARQASLGIKVPGMMRVLLPLLPINMTLVGLVDAHSARTSPLVSNSHDWSGCSRTRWPAARHI